MRYFRRATDVPVAVQGSRRLPFGLVLFDGLDVQYEKRRDDYDKFGVDVAIVPQTIIENVQDCVWVLF